MPDGITFRVVNEREVRWWFGNWFSKSKETAPLMHALAAFYLQQILRTFRESGARDGFPAWRALSPSTLQTDAGTFNIRYGTEKRPKRTAAELREYKTENNLWYKRGIMKGYEGDRRYTAGSKPLLAGGHFMRSFQKIFVSSTRAVVGTRMKKAGDIIGDRSVIRISARDMNVFADMCMEAFLPA